MVAEGGVKAAVWAERLDAEDAQHARRWKALQLNHALCSDCREKREIAQLLQRLQMVEKALKALSEDNHECVVPEKPCASLGIRNPEQMCGPCHARYTLAALADEEGEVQP